jgi:hypothetical protein
MTEAHASSHEDLIRVRRKLRNRTVSIIVGLGIISVLGNVSGIYFWLTLIPALIFAYISYRYWIRPYRKEWREWVKGT